MSQPYYAEIRLFGFNFPPKGWAFCMGQTLSISQNQALFAILGTTYGGNGINTFALPDLRGRTPIHFGQGQGLSSFSLGQRAGEESHTLLLSEMAAHQHTASASTAAADVPSPVGNYWGAGNQIYASSTNSTMKSDALGASGGGQPHPNMQPYLAMNFSIALVGIFPSRN